MANPQRHMSQKYGRLDAVGKSNALRGVISLMMFILLLRSGAALYQAVLAMLAAVSLVVAGYDFPIVRRLCGVSLEWNWGRIRALLIECYPLLAGTALNVVLGTMPRYFLERIKGEEMLGYYASVAVPAMLVQVAATYLYTPLIPRFSELIAKKEGGAAAALSGKICLFVAALALAALLLGRAVGEFALALVFGESIRPYAYLLNPAILCSVLTAYIWFFSMLLTVLHDGTALIVSNAVALAAGLSVVNYSIERFALQGANYCSLFSLAVCLLIQAYRTFRGIQKLDVK